MADDFNNDSLLELYLYESTSLLDALDGILLKAEADGQLTSENINEIFRIMHTIKGSSVMMNYTVVSEVAHSTEGLFSVIRDSWLNMAYFGELFDVVLAVSDFLKAEVGKLQEDSPLANEAAALLSAVKDLTEKMREEQPEQPEQPDEPSADFGRMLGAPQAPKTLMPEAPEGGRILGERLPRTDGPDELAADISKFIANTANDAPAPDEKETWFLHIHFNEGSKMENIRAFMLMNKLAEKGIVNRTIPANPETEPDSAAYIAERGFYISFSTSLFREQIETLIKGTLSVETVSFLRRLPDETGAEAAASEMPKPEPRPRPQTAQTPQAGYTEPRAPIPLPLESPSRPQPQHQPQQQQPQQQPQPQAVQTQAVQTHRAGYPEPLAVRGSMPSQLHGSQSAPDARITAAPRYTEPRRPAFAGTPQPGRKSAPGRPVFYDVTSQAPVQAEPPADRPVYSQPGQSGQPGQQPVQPAQPAPSSGLWQAPDTAQPQPPPAQAQHGTHPGQNIISVELKKLDTLLDLVGEIVINETIVTENPDLKGLELEGFRKAAHHLDKLTGELQDSVMAIRMLPVSIVFQRMRRIVRDMSKSLGKEVDLLLIGETTEVDKTILDAMADPIMHLIRNAMDHAIEPPEQRVPAGKNTCGHIVLSAQTSGSDVIVSVNDDGIGLDKNTILGKARAKGLLRKPETEYSEREIFNLLMAPGFSTRENVTEFSGRGVGLDVVKSNIEKIGGSVSIESKRGIGTSVIMKIPLTLAIIPCIEIAVGKDIYSIPINNIRELFRADAGQLVTDPSGAEMIILRGKAYLVIRLYDRFGNADAVKDIDQGILVLVETGDRSVCLLADGLVGKFQVVVKPLPSYLNRFGVNRSGVSGCTIMGNGNISLIVNVNELTG